MKKDQHSPLLTDVADWMRATDLTEVAYRRGKDAVELRLDDGSSPPPAFPQSTLIPVTAQEVGLYRASGIGKAFNAEEGAVVKKGDPLGLIETGSKKHKITAPESGTLISAPAEDGSPVEYGQPLFFIKP